MDDDGVACSRCGAAFETQDELIVHSIDSHAGLGSDGGPSTTQASAGARGDGGQRNQPSAGELDPETVERLARAFEERSVLPENLTVRYRQRFLAGASVAILGVALALSYLHLTQALDTAVYMFSLGTLFGLTLSYLQAFLQSIRA